MRFAFTEDQLAFRDAFRSVLGEAAGPDVLRASWDARPEGIWKNLGDLGLLSVEVAEEEGGLGLGAADQVLLSEEAGAFALPLPYLETVALAPLLAHEPGTMLTVGEALVPDADTADVLVQLQGDRALRVDRAELLPRQSVDGARRLFEVRGEGTPLDLDVSLLRARLALGTAAACLGLGRRVLGLAVDYAKVRNQFGKAIGSFQAVQHHLVDARLALEFAAPLVYRAAWSLDAGDGDATLHVSMAKSLAAEACDTACRKSLQVHGAIGYTTEFDLHLYLKRAWALQRAWGDAATHTAAVADHVLGAVHA